MILLFTALSLLNVTTINREMELSYVVPDSVVYDSTLASDAVELNFHFKEIMYRDERPIVIQYNIDGGETKSHDGDLGVLTMASVDGHHSLQFYMNENFYEEYVQIVTEGQRRYYFTVDFTSSEIMILTEKPVIYLYPEKTTDVNVEVIPTGKMIFTYPKYDNGWDVVAHPDGKLLVGDDAYNYLFWESEEPTSSLNENMSEGFVISGKESTAFLEEKLTLAGLNSREKTDFITYWAPRMVQHENVFVQFKFNEECNSFAELKVDPVPDQSYRIYMLWKPANAMLIAPRPQEIPELTRKGFTLVEWGGQELPATNQKTTP